MPTYPVNAILVIGLLSVIFLLEVCVVIRGNKKREGVRKDDFYKRQ